MLRNPVKSLLHKTHSSHHLDIFSSTICCLIFIFLSLSPSLSLFFFFFFFFNLPSLVELHQRRRINFSPRPSQMYPHQKKFFYSLFYTQKSQSPEVKKKTWPNFSHLSLGCSCHQLQQILFPRNSGSDHHSDFQSVSFYPLLSSLCTHVNSTRILGQTFSQRLPHVFTFLVMILCFSRRGFHPPLL